MSYCVKCGKELPENALFCGYCGAAVEKTEPEAPMAEAEIPVYNTPAEAPVAMPEVPVYNVPDVAPVAEDATAEEQEFLDTTHRLLRWERKAWSIAGKFFLIAGIIFAALFMFFSMIFLSIGDEMVVLSGVYFVFAFFYGALFIGIGVVSKIAANKTVAYLDSLYADFRPTFDRCGSVGMLVFEVLLGVISPIFFIINFARIKANRALIERIIVRQQGA